MRDFRDSKAMAHTLRTSLASKGLKITVGQSLELIAELFGLPDWNTLAAATTWRAYHRHSRILAASCERQMARGIYPRT